VASAVDTTLRNLIFIEYPVRENRHALGETFSYCLDVKEC
jgi:hypothetical protein